MNPYFQTVGIVGTGAMGRGIAQIAAQAGSLVKLFDVQPDASNKAKTELALQWDKLVTKNKLDSASAEGHKSRLLSVSTLAELADCDLVVEAIVERLDVKQALFAELETIVSPHAVLVSNTSSLSVTAIGWTLHGLWQKRPPAWLTKMFIVQLMVRFAIPMTVLGTDMLFQAFMCHEYISSQAAISSVTTAQNPPTSAAPVTPGLLGKIKSWMGQPITNAIGHYEEIKSAVERAAAHMVTLIGIFVLQTLVIPLLLLWGFYGLARIGLQLPRQPVAMRHPA